MMPSANSDICSSAPPENMLNMPRNVPDELLLMMFFISTRLTPGVVTKTPMR
jgi:hypothetical protein